jgi:UDPglucose--hexose-1-phosphate uridylyltransferase
VPEVRVDPLSGRRTIVAAQDLRLRVRPTAPIDPAGDPFAAGNEERTAPELLAARPDGGVADGPGWTVRVLPSAAPALAAESTAPPLDASPELYTAFAGVGAHEVIVNAAASVASLADLDTGQVVAAVEIWRERMIFHERAACLHLSVSERPGEHTRAELLALDFVPALVARERERFGAYAVRTNGGNLQADLVQEEVRRRVRVVAIDDEAVLLAPYASTVPYQLMLAPRRPRARFQDAGPTGAALLHDGLLRLARRLGGSPPLELWVRTAPRGADVFCWRIDVVPRLGPGDGLDLATGVHRNALPPEQAASDLRDA